MNEGGYELEQVRRKAFENYEANKKKKKEKKKKTVRELTSRERKAARE